MTPANHFAPVVSWPDFISRQVSLDAHVRGRPFELLVRHYLQFDPVYRTKLRHVWLLAEVPEATRMQLNLPRSDQGIDLVAETYTGEFWAVQAKYRTDTNTPLTHRELATFTSLAFTVCRGISYGLVCTTTAARIPGILTGLANLGDLTNEIWADLTPELLAWSKITGNRPRDIPSNPTAYYKGKGWVSWPDFLHPPNSDTSA